MTNERDTRGHHIVPAPDGRDLRLTEAEVDVMRHALETWRDNLADDNGESHYHDEAIRTANAVLAKIP